MKSIKFSHRYTKLPNNIQTAILLAVQKRSVNTLPPDFIDYDTEYFSNETGHKSYYVLPDKGEVLILFLWGEKTLFTTIRKWTPSKEKYYTKSIGCEFLVKIEEKEGN
jgi:hypothetical protein